MEDFKSGFYTTSKKERNLQATLRQSSFTQFQPFFNFPEQNLEIFQKSHLSNHSNVSREAQKANEVCFTPGSLRIQSFWPDEHGTAHQRGTNLQEEIKKLEKNNEKLMQQISLAEGIESKPISLERMLINFQNILNNQNSLS